MALANSHRNGRNGIVLAWLSAEQRCQVQLVSGRVLRLPTTNLSDAPGAAAPPTGEPRLIAMDSFRCDHRWEPPPLWEMSQQRVEELDRRPPSPCSRSGQSVGHQGSEDSGDVALHAQEAFMEEALFGQTSVKFDSSVDEGELDEHELAQ